MLAIAKRELRAYFASMTGYIFIGLFIFMTAVFFSLINVAGAYSDYSVTLTSSNILFLILIPALTMRLFAEETKQKTDQLLFTSPLSINQIVFGKYFAALILFVITLGITIIFPISLSFYGEMPIAKIAGVFIGFFLLGAAFISVGLFISLLTNSQTVAAVATFCVLFMLFIVEALATAIPVDRPTSIGFLCAVLVLYSIFVYDSMKSILATLATILIGVAAIFGVYNYNPSLFDGLTGKVFSWFSVFSRFSNFSKGMIYAADVVYYITFTAFFIFLATVVIERRRLK